MYNSTDRLRFGIHRSSDTTHVLPVSLCTRKAKRDLNRRFSDGLHSSKALSVPMASEMMTPLSTAAPIVRNPGQSGTFCHVTELRWLLLSQAYRPVEVM